VCGTSSIPLISWRANPGAVLVLHLFSFGRAAGGTAGLVERAMLTLRSNTAQVNSVFLVQLRKSLTSIFPLQNNQAFPEGLLLRRDTATLFASAESRPENLVEWATGLSTSSAQEIQKCRHRVFPTGGKSQCAKLPASSF
jgi:hypothetical protein